MDTRFATSPDGTRIAYDGTGTGPAIVLLHGGGGTRHDWHEAGYVERLRDDLDGPRPLRLSEVLGSDGRDFLIAHDGSPEDSSRHYAHAWGLAYYMTFRNALLGTAALDGYVRPSDNGRSPVERFEKLAGTSLDEFEPRWREYLLKLR